MKILALEFSSEKRSVAISLAPSDGVRGAFDRKIFVSASETGPRSLNALSLIDAALKEANLQPVEIDLLAVGLGPGSYTGIRAAISVAQGWQLARRNKLLGVSSVDAIAAQAFQQGLRGRIAVVIDAQRKEFYLAIYEMLAAQPQIVEPLRLVSFSQVKALQSSGTQLIGPEVDRWFPGGRVVFPQAATIAELASSSTDFVTGDKLKPIYLRETSFVKAPPPRRID